MNADDGEILRSIVEKIVCHDDYIELYLKCGAYVKQEYVK